MGLIRKTLAVSTFGVVRPNSKKQRMAKKQAKLTKQENKLLKQLIEQGKKD